MAAATGVGALRPRGRQLYRDLEPGRTAAQLALLLEACRVADRLEQLDQLLLARRGHWARLRLPRGVASWLDDTGNDHIDVELVVSIDGLLSEARQQAIVYRQLILAVAGADIPAAGAAPGKGVPNGDADDLAAIRARNAAAAAAGRA